MTVIAFLVFAAALVTAGWAILDSFFTLEK